MGLGDIFITLVTALTTGVGIYSAWLARRSFHERTYVSFDKLDQMVSVLARKLRRDAFEPDLIVAWPNGGLIAADILWSKAFMHADIASVNFDRDEKMRIIQAELRDVAPAGARYKRILLIDTLVKTGTSMSAAREAVASAYGDGELEIRCASVITTPYAARAINLDYTAKSYDQIPKFPWDSWSRI